MKNKIKVIGIAFLLLLSASYLISAPGSSKKIKFAWDNNTETDLSGYVFYYGVVGSGVTNSVNTTTNTVTINNLVNGQYWFGCTAKNTNNLESDLSNILLFSVPRNPSNLIVQ